MKYERFQVHADAEKIFLMCLYAQLDCTYFKGYALLNVVRTSLRSMNDLNSQFVVYLEPEILTLSCNQQEIESPLARKLIALFNTEFQYDLY